MGIKNDITHDNQGVIIQRDATIMDLYVSSIIDSKDFKQNSTDYKYK